MLSSEVKQKKNKTKRCIRSIVLILHIEIFSLLSIKIQGIFPLHCLSHLEHKYCLLKIHVLHMLIESKSIPTVILIIELNEKIRANRCLFSFHAECSMWKAFVFCKSTLNDHWIFGRDSTILHIHILRVKENNNENGICIRQTIFFRCRRTSWFRLYVYIDLFLLQRRIYASSLNHFGIVDAFILISVSYVQLNKHQSIFILDANTIINHLISAFVWSKVAAYTIYIVT